MVQKSGRERCDGSQHRREEEAAKRQIPQRVQQCVYFDGDYSKHMWNVAGETRFSGLRPKLGLSMCCAVLIITQSCPTLYDLSAAVDQGPQSWDSQVRNTGVAMPSPGDPNPGSNPCLRLWSRFLPS